MVSSASDPASAPDPSAGPTNGTIRIGVLGCGNVGAPLVQLVEQQAPAIEARTGVRLEVRTVAVRNLSKDRGIALPDGVLTRDAHAVVADPDIDLVVELIGGIEPARELISTALANGKPVILFTPPSTVRPGDSLAGPGRITDPGVDDVLSGHVDWGDGSPVEAVPVDDVLRVATLVHAFAQEGTYEVMVEISDDPGFAAAQTGAQRFDVVVANVAPTVDFGAAATVTEGGGGPSGSSSAPPQATKTPATTAIESAKMAARTGRRSDDPSPTTRAVPPAHAGHVRATVIMEPAALMELTGR